MSSAVKCNKHEFRRNKRDLPVIYYELISMPSVYLVDIREPTSHIFELKNLVVRGKRDLPETHKQPIVESDLVL